ncbi:FAD-dependent oxidoreductase [Arcanobacterium ihumii]|uniref:FAD-dependent oxidoreductase n=1 Tax=Arcanobacterium ihumii TaxID=2138162 RepID=UPI000F526FC0|nr:FAD-dependent oxidoreductase [Arcanobacterium ihumii]
MTQPTNQEPDFDVIVIGAGIAGCVAAYELANAGHSVALIERGDAPGSKNLSGGVLYSRVMEEIFPNFLKDAPIERIITRNVLSFLNTRSHVNIDYWDARLGDPVNAVTVLRAKLDAWLADQAEEAGATVLPGVKVDALLREDDQVVGIRAGDEDLRANIVIAADGVNSFIAREVGLRKKEPSKHLAVGVKSVIGLPSTVIEDRFNLGRAVLTKADDANTTKSELKDGVAFAVVGDATQGVAGGGFIYTNEDSVSIGVVLRLDDLVDKGLSSTEIHDAFLAHPAVAPYIRDGKLLEYGCHMTIEDGPAMAKHDLTLPGLMVIGDAAGFTLNTGMTIRGMDLAAQSARSAARAASEALEKKDFSLESMNLYLAFANDSWLGKDMSTYQGAPAFLENPRLYKDYGPFLANIFHELYNINLQPRKKVKKVVQSVFKKSGLKVKTVVKDALAAIRAL